MADLPRPLTTTICSTPAFTASSTMSWMVGVSTMGSISLGMAFVAGRKRVPRPAAGMTTLRSGCFIAARKVAKGSDADHRYIVGGCVAYLPCCSAPERRSRTIATGVMWSRWASGQPSGRGEGWSVGFGYSGAVGQNLFLGGETKFLRYHTPDGLVQKWAQDVGLLARRGNFSWAAVLQNVSIDKIPLFPLTATAAM